MRNFVNLVPILLATMILTLIGSTYLQTPVRCQQHLLEKHQHRRDVRKRSCKQEQRNQQDAQEADIFTRAPRQYPKIKKTIAKLRKRQAEALKKGDVQEAQDSQELLDGLQETITSPTASPASAPSSSAAPPAPAQEESAPPERRGPGRPPGRRNKSTIEREALQRSATRRAILD